jgi:16S rRNA C967 or C1407 C5-methylase (RsmB/RsmF family)/NOL1/NOP2/fmu family ribosome biogenesis protein
MKLPDSLMNSLVNVAGFDKEAFEEVHASSEQVTSIRLNPAKTISQSPNFPLSKSQTVPWTTYGYYLSQRPSFTFDPLFHAGCYYVQEASSMFLEQALRQTADLSKPLRILDLAAAPGGKSTHSQSLITKDSLLICNEVIRSRTNILQDNMIKWGCENVVVSNNDPKDFTKLENYFDVIVVDAPCSGSGLFRRDEEAINEWSLNNVQLCSQRQQRIVADVWPALKRDGILIYSTCSYSKEEDEDILDWMMENLSIVKCQLSIREDWNITETRSASGTYSYRFWPDKVKGEGFFIACIKKSGGDKESSFKPNNKFERLNKKEEEILKQWVKKDQHQFIKHRNRIYAVREDLLNDINFLSTRLRVSYFGTEVGELIREKFIPAHSFAMSNLVADPVVKIELEYEQAIQYLKKKELKIEVKTKGWQLVTYRQHPLGWINVLPNRINNYYPKELRILKDI